MDEAQAQEAAAECIWRGVAVMTEKGRDAVMMGSEGTGGGRFYVFPKRQLGRGEVPLSELWTESMKIPTGRKKDRMRVVASVMAGEKAPDPSPKAAGERSGPLAVTSLEARL